MRRSELLFLFPQVKGRNKNQLNIIHFGARIFSRNGANVREKGVWITFLLKIDCQQSTANKSFAIRSVLYLLKWIVDKRERNVYNCVEYSEIGRRRKNGVILLPNACGTRA